ncbi:unnamed protein product [Adineta steineri]|uniref:Uncharacterized protein n=2 Tax=Adineta steineri TaxID=433720 RepID=A0A819RLZ7_9BILA|nr:unnamed protein product [Adineta steineri]CAF4049718.1 unnamed protein product [Adineta steineri]
MIHLNKHQIFSLHLSLTDPIDSFFSQLIIDSSLNNLQSISMRGIDSHAIVSFLKSLAYLPRLFSLSIGTFELKGFKDLNIIYPLIFTLPKLKFNKLGFIYGPHSSILLPMITNKQFSSIKHLVINHSCTLEQLNRIVSYTPQLHRLSFTDEEDDNNTKIDNHLLSILSQLTHLKIKIYHTTFDRLEMLIKNTNLKLNSLSLDISLEDVNYLESARWEILISKYLSQLNTFHFDYTEDMEGRKKLSTHLKLEESNQFSSLFWSERNWVLETKVNFEFITYSIRPYEKRWYEYAQQPIINSSLQLSKSARLNFTYIPMYDSPKVPIFVVNSVLTATNIYHLIFTKTEASIRHLIYLIKVLPDLTTLKIHDLVLKEQNLSTNETDIFLFISKTNKITKVYLENMTGIEQVDILIKLCPRMNYLQINNINDMEVELFLKEILSIQMEDIDNCLCSLCFRIPLLDDQMMETLEEMIDHEKLLINYTIKRVCDNIYLHWR